MHRARGRELGAAGEGARGEPCGEHKSRQVPAAQRKVVDFILSRVETLALHCQQPAGLVLHGPGE